jgi:glycosyltransferase involved in cell wall biosynthesis
MENKVDVSVILPMKSSKAKDFEEYFNKAIQSIQNQITQVNELVIVSSNESSLVEYLENYDFGELNVKKIIWDKEPNYCSQLNFGVENASSKWISIFEFDDEYSTIWFKNVKKHIEAFKC